MRHALMIVGRRLRPGGVASEAILGATRLLAQNLADQGLRVIILGLVDEGPRLRRVREAAITYHLVNRHRWGQGEAYRQAMRRLITLLALREGRPPLLFINHFFPLLRPLRYRRDLFLISVPNTLIHPPALTARTLILAENTHLLAKARQHYPRHRIELFYPGVDLRRFTPRRQGRPGSPIRFLFASSPLPEHDDPVREQAILDARGVPLALRLSEHLAPHLPMETVLLWRKSPDYIHTRLPHKAPVRIEVREIADMATYWENFDFCWALFRDAPDVKGMPQSLLEALAKGIPPIVREGSSWAELLLPRGAAIAVHDPPVPADLEAIIAAATDPQRYRALSEAARQTAEALFDVEEQAHDLYQRLFGGG